MASCCGRRNLGVSERCLVNVRVLSFWRAMPQVPAERAETSQYAQGLLDE